MVKYQTNSCRYGVESKITAVEIIKETEKQVHILVEWEDSWSKKKHSRVYRELKESQYHHWHDTWEEAHAYLMEQANRHVESIRLNLERAKGALGNIKGMKKPE